MPEERHIFNLAPAVPTENILRKMRQRFDEFKQQIVAPTDDDAILKSLYEAAWIGMCVPHAIPPDYIRQNEDSKSVFVYNKDKHVYDQFDLVEPQE